MREKFFEETNAACEGVKVLFKVELYASFTPISMIYLAVLWAAGVIWGIDVPVDNYLLKTPMYYKTSKIKLFC